MNPFRVTCAIAVFAGLVQSAPAKAAEFEAGFARVDVTPQMPVRMSGYGGRDHASEGTDTPLHARAMALRTDGDGGQTFVLVTFDTIGTPAAFTDDVVKRVSERHKVPRERF